MCVGGGGGGGGGLLLTLLKIAEERESIVLDSCLVCVGIHSAATSF